MFMVLSPLVVDDENRPAQETDAPGRTTGAVFRTAPRWLAVACGTAASAAEQLRLGQRGFARAVIRQRVARLQAVAQHEARDFPEYQWSYRVGDILIPNIRFEEPLRAECQHFIDCVVHNTPPVSCGEDGAAVVRVLEAAQRSLTNSGHQEVLRW